MRAVAASAVVELLGVSKSLGGTQALADVHIAITPGEVHALVGENGAGKSTLGKLIGGVHTPDSGQMLIDGTPVRLRTPADALRRGITVMQQEIAIAPDLSVMENVALGQQPARWGLVRKGQLRRQFTALTERYGFDLPADAPAGRLPLALQQQIEILRALARNARVIVMDEPTAALPATAAQELHTTVRELAANGVAVVYVSHFLEETLALCDSVTVLRNGRVVTSRRRDETTVVELIEAMLGRAQASTYPALKALPAAAPPRLDVRQVALPGRQADANLTIRAGEIVGLFGLVGSGRSSLAHALIGAGKMTRGHVVLDGEPYTPANPRKALHAGVALLPESRREQGLFLDHTQRLNAVVTDLRACSRWAFIQQRVERRAAATALSHVAVKTSNLKQPVGELSGGNQQKVLLAKTLYRDPRILILDEPTRGVDVGARRAIYETLVRLTGQGLAILLISSDLEEVDQMSHRLIVMRDGGTVAEFPSRQASHDEILHAAFGVAPEVELDLEVRP